MIPELYYSLEAGAKAPVRASVDASGFDLFAHEDTAIEPDVYKRQVLELLLTQLKE